MKIQPDRTFDHILEEQSEAATASSLPHVVPGIRFQSERRRVIISSCRLKSRVTMPSAKHFPLFIAFLF
jgi:hypothetical protein